MISPRSSSLEIRSGEEDGEDGEDRRLVEGGRVTEVRATVTLDIVVTTGVAPTLQVDPLSLRVTVQCNLAVQLKSESSNYL